MVFAVIGGDARFARLAELLRARGCAVRTDSEGVEEADVVVAQDPAKTPFGSAEALAARARPGALLILHGCAGPLPGGARCVDLMRIEEFVARNARLTAEGALSVAMNAEKGALSESCCLVVGYGRIARWLTRMLLALGARVTVAARGEPARREATEAGARAVDCSEAALCAALAEADFTFSTPPAMLLTGDVLRCAKPGARVIDLASPPYGVDVDAADELGVRAWRENGLPGRYCPRAAAQVMLEFIDRIVAEGRA